MPLIEIIRTVADEIGLVLPDTVVGNTDLTARRILACAKAEAEGLFRAANWSILQREHPFTTTANEENYAVPTDFGRMLSRTAWDQAQYRRIRGSVSPSEWQRLRNSTSGQVGISYDMRLLAGPLAGSVLLTPTPTASGDALIYEYITKNLIESSIGDGQSNWLADDDELRIENELFRLGLLWRVKRAVGLPFADERNDAENELADAVKADTALDVISMKRYSGYQVNLPEGSWPS